MTLFKILEDACIHQFMAPSSYFQNQYHSLFKFLSVLLVSVSSFPYASIITLPSLTVTLLPPSYQNLVIMLAFPDNPGYSLYLYIFILITSTKSLLPCKAIYSQFQGLICGHLQGHLAQCSAQSLNSSFPYDKILILCS